MLDDIKKQLRLSHNGLDGEIIDLIQSAKSDLKLSGIKPSKVDKDTDPLIKRAVSTYVKANFGWDNPDSEKLQRAYDLLKQHLSLSDEYGGDE